MRVRAKIYVLRVLGFRVRVRIRARVQGLGLGL